LRKNSWGGRESNPGRLVEKRERYFCAMPTPLPMGTLHRRTRVRRRNCDAIASSLNFQKNDLSGPPTDAKLRFCVGGPDKSEAFLRVLCYGAKVTQKFMLWRKIFVRKIFSADPINRRRKISQRTR
jgi:hypothetical protein